MKLHMQPGGKGDQIFTGSKMIADVDSIKKLIVETESHTILDYGSGKGCLYKDKCIAVAENEPLVTLLEFWGIKDVTCYDPCYPPYSSLPAGKYDGVVCIDVLEHCPEEDIPWIVREILGYANCFVYANVACDYAAKTLPSGENVHATVRSPDWWGELFYATGRDFPDVRWELLTTMQKEGRPGLWFPVKKYVSKTK